MSDEALDGIEATGGSVAGVKMGECGGDSLARQAIIKLFDNTRKRLVETGTRNRLVHVNRANTRGNVLNIVNKRSDDVSTLLSGGKTIRFAALGQDGGEDRGQLVLGNDRAHGPDEGRVTDNHLGTQLGPVGVSEFLCVRLGSVSPTIGQETVSGWREPVRNSVCEA